MSHDTLPYLQGLDDFIKQALREDIGDGDHTSLSCIPSKAEGTARLIVKDQGIIAGIELAKRVFHIIDPAMLMETFINDGETVKHGDIAFTVKGNSRSILTAERLVLNCMQRMSGIATTTNKYVQELKGLNTKVLDTRKTTPNFRIPEKWAVVIGGGVNHRFGLFDMILIKDNHIDYAGGVVQAINATHKYLKETGKNLKIEVEARTLSEIKDILNTGGIHRILIDNFSTENIKEAVKLIDGKVETEASGGITFDTLRAYAESGVDYISVGALTHSSKSLDMSLKASI